MARTRIAIALSMLIASSAAAQELAERVVVPLTDPGAPAFVHVEMIQGSISVEAHGGSEVMVDLSTRAREALGDEPAAATESEAAERADGLRRLPPSGLGFSVEERDNRVTVMTDSWRRPIDLTIKVPVRSSLTLRTTNHGEIAVTGVHGDLELTNVNGPITASGIRGSVVASSTNGDVTIELIEVTEGKAMAFSTLNGDVDVSLPADLKAELRLRSQYGEIFTGFEVEMVETKTRVERNVKDDHYRVLMEGETLAQVNGGGPELTFRTFNGDILVRKGRRR